MSLSDYDDCILSVLRQAARDLALVIAHSRERT